MSAKISLMISLTEIKKDSNLHLFRIATVVLVIVSSLIFYFFRLNVDTKLGSSVILEYKFENIQLEEVETFVKERVKPERVEKTADGRIRFYLQNITEEEYKDLDRHIGNKFQFSKERIVTEIIPAYDSSLLSRYAGIAIFSLLGFIIAWTILLAGKIKLIRIVQIIFAGFLTVLFEIIILFGFNSLGGLLGLKFGFLSLYAIIAVLILSIFYSYFVLGSNIDEMKEAKDLGLFWDEKSKWSLETFKLVFLIEAIVLIPLVIADINFLASSLNVFVGSVAAVYSAMFVLPEILGFSFKRDDNK